MDQISRIEVMVAEKRGHGNQLVLAGSRRAAPFADQAGQRDERHRRGGYRDKGEEEWPLVLEEATAEEEERGEPQGGQNERRAEVGEHGEPGEGNHAEQQRDGN